jgi:hypothetical protein
VVTANGTPEPVRIAAEEGSWSQDDEQGVEPATALWESLDDAIDRLAATGFILATATTEDGRVACRMCAPSLSPAPVRVRRECLRTESVPDDETILLALACDAGCQGLYGAAIRPSTGS